MIGGSLLAVLPKGFFSWPSAIEESGRGQDVSPMALNDEGDKKRRREEAISGGSTGFTLISALRGFACRGACESFDDNDRPRKRLRGQSKHSKVQSSVEPSTEEEPRKQNPNILKKLPEDVVSHCLSFLGTAEDRFAIQTTCKRFREISNSNAILEQVDLFGDVETGKKGIIRETDTPSSAAATLAPFARAGNLEALYMLGIVKCYCYQDLKNGILMLKMASQRGFVRASYSLGIILRDSMPGEAKCFMNLAASTGYFPALQEVLPGSKMKERFGEPDAAELRRHLDPMCLVGLLLRDYVGSAELRGLNTNHCWNPLCGRWAYKTTHDHSATRMRRSLAVYDLDGEAEPIIDRTAVPPQRERSIVELVDGCHDFDGDKSTVVPRASTCKPHSCKAIQALAWEQGNVRVDRVSRMKLCSRCCRAKYCSKLCQVYDWRSDQHKMECQFL